MLWIEAQSTPVIALVVFGLSYLFAAVIFVMVAIVAPRPWARHFKLVSPVTLTPLAVVLAVLLGFLASRVWTNFDRANGYISQEASALNEALLMAQAFPQDVQTRLRSAINIYIKSVVEEEWPAMSRHEARASRSPRGLTEAVAATLALGPTNAGEQAAQQRALVALNRVLDARQNRIMLSGENIAHIQWWVIVVLIILIEVTIAMVHIDNHRTSAIALVIFATAGAISVVLLLAYDQPLAAGGVLIQPTELRELMAN